MHKKSQIAIFVIVGVIILAVIIYFLALRNAGTKTIEQTGNSEYGAVERFVQECADNSAKQAVLFSGKEGGYFSNSSLSVYDEFGPNDFRVPYYLRNGSVFTPTIQTVQGTIADWFSNQMAICTNNFEDFPGINITAEEPTANVTITKEKVLFLISYPITLRKDSSETKIDRFNSQVSAETTQIFSAVNEYMNSQKDMPDSFLFGVAEEVALRYNLSYSTVFLENKKTIIMVFSKNESVLGEPYEWWFGLGYE